MITYAFVQIHMFCVLFERTVLSMSIFVCTPHFYTLRTFFHFLQFSQSKKTQSLSCHVQPCIKASEEASSQSCFLQAISLYCCCQKTPLSPLLPLPLLLCTNAALVVQITTSLSAPPKNHLPSLAITKIRPTTKTTHLPPLPSVLLWIATKLLWLRLPNQQEIQRFLQRIFMILHVTTTCN